MAQLSAAIFDHREDAQRAVHALRDHGVDEDSISVLAVADDGSGKVSDLDHGERVPAPGKDEGLSVTTPGDAAKGAAEGAAIGAGLGLVAALSSIFIPGFGLITAGGALATALWGAAGAAAGGTLAGGVTGFLADMGVPDDTAREYHDSLKKGGVLVSVHDTDEATADEIQQIFHKYNGRNAGAYSHFAENSVGFATPQSLDATNERLAGSGGVHANDVTNSNDRINTGGDLSRSEVSPSAGRVDGVAAGAMAAAPHLDAVEGDEGSATSRLGDVRVGSPPNDFGASTTELEGTTNAVIDTGIAGSTTSGLGTGPDNDVRAELSDTPSGSIAGNLGATVGGVGGMSSGMSPGLGNRGDMGDSAGGTTPGGSLGAVGGTTGAFMERSDDLMNTTEDMTGRSGTDNDRPLTGAEVAGTAGGASAGANDGGLGDLESNSRADDDITSRDLSQPGPGLDNTSGHTSGRTVGGSTYTGGSGGITTSGGADTSPTLSSTAVSSTTARTLDEDEDVR